ncbi:MAG: segregation/condensation protein A [Halobacteriales archaeon]
MTDPVPDGGEPSDAGRPSSGLRTDGGMTEAVDGEPPTERIDAEEEPIELLVQLAEEGEIDPWNIDIVRVTDKFLERLDAGDLRESARALFYAAVLLRLKSDALLAPDEPDEPDPLDAWDAPRDDPAMAAPGGGDPIASLEDELDRRLERKRVRGGTPETLDELVRELREHERQSWWKDHRTYDTSGSPSGFMRGTQTLDYRADDAARMDDEPTAHDVTATAHAEDMQATIDDVWAVLATHFDAGREEVLFAEVDGAGGSRVETYLGVLFLAHRGRLDLEQDELFGDLWLRAPDAGDPATAAAGGDAIETADAAVPAEDD